MIFNSSAQTERYSIIDKSGFKYEFPLRAQFIVVKIYLQVFQILFIYQRMEVPWIIHLDKAKCILLCPKVMF